MKRFFASFVLLSLSASAAFADTVTLNTGRKLTGIVVSLDEDPQIELEVGSGKIVLSRSEVLRVDRADPGNQQAMRDVWAQKKINAEAEFQQGLAQERLRDETGANLQKLEAKQTNLRSRNGYLFVDASLNNGPKTEFLLDTGAPIVVLTRDFGRRLGLLEGSGPQGQMSIARKTLLVRSVRIPRMEVEGFWATQVPAVVYLQDPQPGEDDLLSQNIVGMSFLQNFHFQINVKRAQLTLSWEEL